ncbi:hypothetical protein ACQR1W_15345 [Bradyrhizobium sp. HKCCYLS1011]|uniref:hypothetical protein n=1 Tax=Bradyrhizobium sp. HKCCYLS1011 TaxID=3420733 RepID=UPI003EBBFBEE
MSVDLHRDDLAAVVRYALETTRSTTVCPFHEEVLIRVGDDAAESHALELAKRITKSDGSTWDREALRREIGRQLVTAADGRCPLCEAT